MEARRMLEDSYQRDLLAINELVGRQQQAPNETTSSCVPNSEVTILDPPHIKTKGRSKGRIKGPLEKTRSRKAPKTDIATIVRKEQII